MNCNFKYQYKTNFKKNINNEYKKFSGFYNNYETSFDDASDLMGKLQSSLGRLKNDCEEIFRNGGIDAHSYISGKVTCDEKDYGLGVSCKKQLEDDKAFVSYQSFSFEPSSQDDRLVIHSTYEEAVARFETLIEA